MTPMQGFYIWLGLVTLMILIGIYWGTIEYRTYRKNKKLYYRGLGICSLPKYDKKINSYRIGGLVRPRFRIPDLRHFPPCKDKAAADAAFQEIMINEVNKAYDNRETTLTRHNYLLVFTAAVTFLNFSLLFYEAWKQHALNVDTMWIVVLCVVFVFMLQGIVNIINKKLR